MNLLRRVVDVRPGEVRAMFLACAYFFFVLSAYYVLRPIRDTMGVAGGIRNVPWLFTGTLLAMIAVQPLFAAVVRRFPARRFIPITYHFFAANLLAFFLLMRALPDSQDVWIGRAFFIWVSVFNLFVVSVFWAFMVDLFRTEQSKRLFGFIGVGGTIGAISGGAITAFLVAPLGATNLLLVSAGLLEVAVFFVLIIARNYERIRAAGADAEAPGAALSREEDRVVGGGVMAGITHALKSPYVLMICSYMLLYTITSTFLYLQQLTVVEAAISGDDARTAFFAKIDMAINVLTLITQAFITGRLLKYLGVGITLALLPAISVLGFGAIGMVPTLMMVIGLNVVRRAGNFAVARPTREVLFTVVPREDKYKVKTFVDTFVYRLGDQVGGWSQNWLGALGIVGIGALAWVAVPLATIWVAVALWLGRRHKVLHEEGVTAADLKTRPAPVAV